MEKSPQLILGMVSRLQAHVLRRLVIIYITFFCERECRFLLTQEKVVLGFMLL